jgi:hypothetical protein
MGPSRTIGATMSDRRRPATKVVVFQWPCGMPALSLSPLGERPRRRAMLVEAQVSSMKEALGRKVELPLEPVQTPLQDVRAALFGRV